MTERLTVLSADGSALFRVTPRPAFDEWRGDYLACALRFAAMHDAFAEAFAAPTEEPVPTPVELTPAARLLEWLLYGSPSDGYADTVRGLSPVAYFPLDGWEVAPVGRARRLLEWLLYG